MYRWFNEDVARERRAIRDEHITKLIGQWKDTDELREPVPITSCWQLIKTIWALGGKP